MVPKGRQGWPCASHSQFHVPTAGSHRAPQPDWWGLCETFLRKGRNTPSLLPGLGFIRTKSGLKLILHKIRENQRVALPVLPVRGAGTWGVSAGLSVLNPGEFGQILLKDTEGFGVSGAVTCERAPFFWHINSHDFPWIGDF